jgi:hypothetical protein
VCRSLLNTNVSSKIANAGHVDHDILDHSAIDPEVRYSFVVNHVLQSTDAQTETEHGRYSVRNVHDTNLGAVFRFAVRAMVMCNHVDQRLREIPSESNPGADLRVIKAQFLGLGIDECLSVLIDQSQDLLESGRNVATQDRFADIMEQPSDEYLVGDSRQTEAAGQAFSAKGRTERVVPKTAGLKRVPLCAPFEHRTRA